MEFALVTQTYIHTYIYIYIYVFQECAYFWYTYTCSWMSSMVHMGYTHIYFYMEVVFFLDFFFCFFLRFFFPVQGSFSGFFSSSWRQQGRKEGRQACIMFISRACIILASSFLQASPNAMGGRHCALPPNPPPAFSTLSYQTNISIHPPIIQSINLTICLFVYLYIYIYESRSNYLHRHGGEALRPPPQPPSSFFIFFKHHRIQKIYTCIHPSLIQLIALCISFFVYLTLCRSCNVLVSVHQTPWGGGAASSPPTPLHIF